MGRTTTKDKILQIVVNSLTVTVIQNIGASRVPSQPAGSARCIHSLICSELLTVNLLRT